MYEIEIKSLLGSKERAEALKSNLSKKFPAFKKLSQHRQLNHYFVGGDFTMLYEKLKMYLPQERQTEFFRLLKEGKEFSLRSREADGKVLIVLKASVGDDTSANGVSRMEFEAPVGELSLAELDAVLLSCGFTYQAKWSREREEYGSKDTHVTIDKNAGYGYLAEFEKVIANAEEAEEARQELAALMQELGCEELPQERLERMFAHYNKHWEEYYGTDKVFIVE